MPQIDDYTPLELTTVERVVQARYGAPVTVELADSELKLDPDGDALTWCPSLHWSEGGANFVVFKIAPARYRNLFYYHPSDQYTTGIESYTDVTECVTHLLHSQADHALTRAEITAGKGSLADLQRF